MFSVGWRGEGKGGDVYGIFHRQFPLNDERIPGMGPANPKSGYFRVVWASRTGEWLLRSFQWGTRITAHFWLKKQMTSVLWRNFFEGCHTKLTDHVHGLQNIYSGSFFRGNSPHTKHVSSSRTHIRLSFVIIRSLKAGLETEATLGLEWGFPLRKIRGRARSRIDLCIFISSTLRKCWFWPPWKGQLKRIYITRSLLRFRFLFSLHTTNS